MKNWFLLLILLFFFSTAQSQNAKTILEELHSGKMLKLDWVHQQYSSERKSIPTDHPLFPSQFNDGEGESIIGLKLKMDNCDEPPCQVKVWVEYLSAVRFSDRQPYTAGQGFFQSSTPPDAALFPKMVDTRYSDTGGNEPSSLVTLDSLPLMADVDKGLLQSDWAKDLNLLNNMPAAFTYEYFQDFLKSLWQQKWVEKEHFQLVKKKQVGEKTSVHYFRPVHPAKPTIVTGVVNGPVSNEIDIGGLREGSWVKTWGEQTISLDENNQFHISVLLDHPRKFRLSHGFNTLVLYVEPGDSLHLNIDANAFYRNTTFSGDGILANQFLLDYYHQERGDVIFQDFNHDLFNQGQSAYLANMQERENKELAFLKRHEENLAPSFVNQFAQSIRLENVNMMWYYIPWFYKTRDAKIEPSVLEVAQEARKYFFRLPEDREYDFLLDSYLEFQQEVLKGKYIYQHFPSRTYDNYGFAKMLYSPKNTYRFGRLLLFLKKDDFSSTSYEKLYENVRSLCHDEKELKILEDYRNPNLNQGEPKGRRAFASGSPAPNWDFVNESKDSIQLSNYLGDYLLLHIGLAKNLNQALEDIAILQKENTQKIKTLSIVSSTDPILEKIKQESVVYIPYAEMKDLRDNYAIENNANQFLIIDPEGRVVSNQMVTSSFNKLKSEIKKIPTESKSPLWKPSEKFWRNTGIFSLFLLLLSGIYVQRKRVLAKREEQRRQLLEFELKGIRSQMNPHFLFNALGSIQNLIRKKDNFGADRYLTLFAGLVRKILQNSEQEFITLAEEINAIEQYCSLESLRTPFEYNITITEDIDPHNTYIPGMLLQPLIENAILHGLSPLSSDRNLWIAIKKQKGELFCEIKDNGIGLKKAALRNKQEQFKRKSYGLTLVKQRLQLLLNKPEKEFIKIIDRLSFENKNGTIVQLTIPTEK
ncbi:MAG: sensor histidine kinase [Saprospiraceae bacterium]